MGTRRFPAYAATIGTVILFALSGASQALAAPGDAPSASEPENSVICDGATPVVTPTSISCTIDQTANPENGQNRTARCIERSSQPLMSETCIILQANTTGRNTAVVIQEIRQNDGPSQSGQQRARIEQANGVGLTSGGGVNAAGVSQNISQTTDSAGAQDQASDQGNRFGPGVSIDQTNRTGANLIGVNQAAVQKARTHNSSATQLQRAQEASHLDEHTGGFSRSVINQDVDQNARGALPANQTQIADPHCCNIFDGSNVRVDLRQDITQWAGMHAHQSATNTAHCLVTVGTCNLVETINQNGHSITTTCSDSECLRGQTCADGHCNECGFNEQPACPPPSECFLGCRVPTLSSIGLSARLDPAATVGLIRAVRLVRILTT